MAELLVSRSFKSSLTLLDDVEVEVEVEARKRGGTGSDSPGW